MTAETTAGALAADTALEPLGGGRWLGTLSERWWIERGPYGGFVSALLVRALEAAVDDPSRAPRSITVHFLAAPAAGPVEIAATVERAGRSASTVSLRMEQDARNVAWVRPAPAMALDHLAVTALSDTIVPAAFSRFGRLLIVPTLDLTIHFRAPLPAGEPGDWALVSFDSQRSAGGTWEEDGEVWSADGRLLAQSRQLAMIRERS